MKKRGLSLFLALVLCLSLLPATAWAEGTDTTADTWDGTADTSWYDSENPQDTYTLTTAAELAGLASLVNSGTSFSGKTITLNNSIDLNSQSWTPIGTSSKSFSGTFDGSGNTISNLTVNTTSDHAGLFGCVNGGTVKNLNAEGTVTAKGADIGAGGVVGYTNATVENCSFSGTVTGTADEILCIGGVVGRADTATVKNCSFSGAVTGTNASFLFAGGVVGYNSGTVANCYNTGNVSGSGNAGGVVGCVATNSTVKYCYNTGDVSGSGNVGGVVGYAYDESTAGNCYNTGDVSGSGNAGGVVGYAAGNADLQSHAVYVKQCYFLRDENTNKDLSGVGASNGRVESGSTEAKTADAFASGEVAWLLRNNNFGDANPPWRQNLSGEDADNSPVLDSTHAQVVLLDNGSYANAPKTDETGVYLIYTADDLAAFAALVNSSSNPINAKLMNNIDLSTVCGATIGESGGAVSWTPIGNTISNPNVYFQGTFDGQGHTVSGLYMNITSTEKNGTYGGLFGDMRGTVKNLNVNGTVAVTNESSIYVYVGGVVGEADNATVENCSFTGKVTGTGKGVCVGGVVGRAYDSTVKYCYNTGNVSGSSYVGGVVGYAGYTTNSGTVSNCYFLQDTGTNTGLHGIGNNTTSTGAEPKTAAEFASGEVAWLLNGGDTQNETSPWRQNLGDAGDAAPTLDSTHARVVKLGNAYLNPPEQDAAGVYEISTAAELVWFANEVNSGQTSIKAKLMKDIDLSSVCGADLGSWTPIGNGGNDSQSFQGTFDGQGHTVSGLYVSISKTNVDAYAGLFGYVYGGTVKNLAVSGEVTAEVTTSYTTAAYAGGVVGYHYDGNVENCSFSGNVSASVSMTSKALNNAYAGGVVGRTYSAPLKNCFHTGTVTATATGSGTTAYAGGVIGSNYATVTNCYHTGTVTASGGSGGSASYAGGVAGRNSGTVSNCYFLEDVNLNGIGYNTSTSGAEPKTEDTFANGEVAHLLQNGQTDTVWVQKLAESGNKSPVLAAFLTADEVENYTVYQVTFQTGNASDPYATAYANKNTTVTLPNDPDMGTGNVFVGWYNGNTEFTAETKVTENITVTAKVRPDISINYETETLTGFVSGATYTINGTEVTLDDNNTLPITNYMGKTISIVRKDADGSGESVAQSLPIPARPNAPTVEINNTDETLSTTTGMEYKVGDNGAWADCSASMDATAFGSWDGSASVIVYFRTKATNTSFASAAQTVTIPARPAAPELSIDTSTESVTISADYYYNTTSSDYTSNSWTQGTGSAVTVAPGGNIYIYKAAVTTEGKETFKSAVQTLTAPTRGTAPGVSINYGAETLSTTTGMEYRVGENGTWTDCTDNMTATSFGHWNGSASVTVQFRTKATETAYASSTQEVTISTRPAAPELSIDTSTESVTVPSGYYYGTTDNTYANITTAGTGSAVTVAPGTNIYIYQAATNSAFKSAIQTLTAPTRGAAPTVSIDYGAETLSTTTGMEYKVGESGTWADCSASMDATVFGWDGTTSVTVYFRAKATTTAYASDAQTVTIPARPAAPNLSISTSTESVTVSTDYYYNTTSSNYTGNGWMQGTGSAVTVEEGGSIYIYKAAVTEGENAAFKSAVQTLTAPTRGTAPSVGINYGAETLSTTTDMEYRIGTSGTWTACTAANMDTTAFGWDGTTSVTVYFRAKATTDKYASDAQTVTIPARPDAPSNIKAQNETITGFGDGKLTGMNEAKEYEYSSDNGTTWSTCTADTAVTSGTYLVRYAATESSFVSASASVTVGANIVVTTPDGTTPEYDETGKATLPGGTTITGKTENDETVTITVPEEGEITVNKDEETGETTLTVPGGSTVEIGDTKITIGEDTTGATVDKDGGITLPEGGTVTIETKDGETVTITVPEGGEIAVNEGEGETTITVPDGTTVQTGDGPKITLPDGGEVAEDGSVTAGTVQVGDTTITAPEDKTVTTTPDGTTTAPGGSTVTTGGTDITIGENTTGTTVDKDGGITLPEGGTATVETKDGKPVTITAPESGGTVSVGEDGNITLPGGSTVTVDGKTTTIPTAGGKLDPAAGTVTVNSSGGSGSSAPTYPPTVEKTDNGSVSITPTSPKQGATVTVTPEPDAGYEVDTITVTDKNGNPVQVTDKGNGTYSFTQPAGRVTVKVTFAESTQPPTDLPFTDVDPAAWYAEAVRYMLERGMMAGTAPDTFSPDSATTRAMVVTILYRLEGEPNTSGNTAFTDVDSGTWYTDPIAWAAANGVVTGTSPTTFEPDAPVTREQMAAILYRYLAAKGYDVAPRADLSAYTDAGQISPYATETMSWANAVGLLTGETPTTLVPQGNATRAQVATILMRFCETVAQP